MEPAPCSITQYQELKGWAKEKLGKLFMSKKMVKEGQAIEKAAHPERQWAKAEERLKNMMEIEDGMGHRDSLGRRHTS